MATFLMLGKYSSDSLRQISSKRTEKALKLVRRLGGEVKSVYALLGDYDLAVVLELPGNEKAMEVSIALGKLTGISFKTSPAVTVEEFDKLATQD
jgi:uncharacterized protein with GYD domain